MTCQFLLSWNLAHAIPDSLCTTQDLNLCKSGFNLDHFQAVSDTISTTLAALATLAFTDNTQYMLTGNIEVLSWFLESVPPRLLVVNVSVALSSMVQ